MLGIPERKNAFFSALFFLTAQGAAECRIKLSGIKRLFECLCFHDVGVERAMRMRGHTFGQPLSIGVPISLTPTSLVLRPQNSIIALNFRVVSICSKGNSRGEEKDALSARCNRTVLASPIE